MIRILTSSRCFTFVFAVTCFLIAAISANAQATRKNVGQAASEDPPSVFNEYRGIQLGMTPDVVRQKLGNPKEKGDEQDFFIFGDTETALVVYDKTRKVSAISADFLNAGAGVLTPKQVVGSEIEAKADGSMYKVVRFPKAGYWLSYNRTGGATPMITVTLQKIE